MRNHPISAVIITYNCGEILKKTLEAVQWCDEILVVDSGSTDKTIEICRQFHCTIHHHPFEGYGKQKKYAVQLAKNDWILSIDGDEIVTSLLKDEIEGLFSKSPGMENGYCIPISLVFLGKAFRFGNENKKPHLRLFNRKHGNFNEAAVHESISLDGKIKILKHEILHYSYLNIQHYFEKLNHYTSFYAIEASQKGKTVTRFKIISRIPVDFINFYFLKRNFLNGYEGFVWSIFSAYYCFVKHIKLFELQHT
jgi:glycosyltransferase involved in cell wall biosynthesis